MGKGKGGKGEGGVEAVRSGFWRMRNDGQQLGTKDCINLRKIDLCRCRSTQNELRKQKHSNRS